MSAGPFSISAQPNSPVKLANLQLWRIQPKPSTLHDRIPPSKEQRPIVMTAMRVSGRKFVTGIWSVSNGEAFFVSFYDPKAVVTLELTVLCGWWAELGLPPVTAMAYNDLQGLAAYVMQGISVQMPQPDCKGLVDMAKASLRFDLGPPPPRFEIDLQPTNKKIVGQQSEERACEPDQARRTVLWKVLRRFDRRAVLLAFARDGPSIMIIRGWDSSMAWRMTNVITFHEVDWRQWIQPRDAGLKRPLPVAAALYTKIAAKSSPRADNTRPDSTDASHKGTIMSTSPAATHRDLSSLRNINHLCQRIADRVEMRREGTCGGKIALRPPRRAGVGRRGIKKEVGDEGEELPRKILEGRRYFLSHKDMERRVKELDSKERRPSPRRLSKDPDGSLKQNMTSGLPPGASIGALAHQMDNGAEKTRLMEEAVEQLLRDAKQQEEIQMLRREKVIGQWKWVGRALCRILRISDYWYGFAVDQTLSGKERAARRISVLRKMVQVRTTSVGGGYATMRTLLRMLTERYPRSLWTKFRLLMRQPKAERCRRDMSVCAMLMSGIDNPFFRYTTANWPFPRLIDLATDARLVKKPSRSVLYEDGETAPKLVGSERRGPTTGGGGVDLRDRVGSEKRAGSASQGESHVPGSEASDGASGGMGVKIEKGQEDDEKGAVGVYVILRGSVDLYVFERGHAARLPTVALQEEFATKASRGQPMHEQSPRVERDSSAGRVAALHGGVPGARRENRNIGQSPRLAVAKEYDASFSGTGTSGAHRDCTRNFGPRWRASRLGPGALFGDCPHVDEYTGGLDEGCHGPRGDSLQCHIGANHAGSTGGPDPNADEHRGYPPALETAVTTETTELLEIGVGAYRELLAVGAREKIGGAVAVLRATQALDDVPTLDLERICRYSTDRTIFGTMPTDFKHPPLLNPGAEPRRNDQRRGRAQQAVCRRDAFQTTVFFVAEGSGEVVLGDHRSDPSGGPVAADNLFRTNRKRRRQSRRQKEGIKRSSASKCGRNPSERDGLTLYMYPTVRGDCQSTVLATDLRAVEKNECTGSVAKESNNGSPESTVVTKASRSVSPSPLENTSGLGSGSGDEWGLGAGEEGLTVPAAILQRGDFFGIAPMARSTQDQQKFLPLNAMDVIGENGSVNVQGTLACSLAVAENTLSTSPTLGSEAMEAVGVSTAILPVAASVKSAGRICWSQVEATATPPSMTKADTSADELPSKEFPALHKASLFAGQGGLRCLAVRLVVLQKICPSVYRRLAVAAAERYSEWMGEAVRRDEKLWNERLSSGSVQSLSRSFYRSFAKADYSGSVASPASDDRATFTLAENSCGGGSSNTLSFSGTGKESISGDDSTVSVYPIPPSKSLGTNKSIFDMSQGFRRLASCSTAGTLIPDRPGRTLLYLGANHRLMKPAPPSRVDERCRKSKIRGSYVSPRTSVVVAAVPNSPYSPSTTGKTAEECYDDSSFDSACAEDVNRDALEGPGTIPAAASSLEDKTHHMSMDGVGSLSLLGESRRKPWECLVSPFIPFPHSEIPTESSPPESLSSGSNWKDVEIAPAKAPAQSHFSSSCSSLDSATRPVEGALTATLISERHKGSQWSLKEPRWRRRKRVHGPFASRKGKEDRMNSVLPQTL